jgi:hypothetical protein
VSDTTFEEAKRHHVCGEAGQEVKTQRGDKPGVVVHVFECKNERCADYEGRWMVQTNPDGSIPTPGNRGPKAFASLPGNSTNLAQNARDYLRMIEVWDLHPTWSEQDVVRYLQEH